jgi:hypothetical protein
MCPSSCPQPDMPGQTGHMTKFCFMECKLTDCAGARGVKVNGKSPPARHVRRDCYLIGKGIEWNWMDTDPAFDDKGLSFLYNKALRSFRERDERRERGGHGASEGARDRGSGERGPSKGARDRGERGSSKGARERSTERKHGGGGGGGRSSTPGRK